MPQLSSCDYDHYDIVKCRRDVNIEEMDMETSGKNDLFWLLWGIFKKYIKQNIIMAVFKKSKFSLSCHLQIEKKVNNAKEHPRRETDSNFNLSEAA